MSLATTTFVEATKKGNQERCQQLLSEGADVNGTTEVCQLFKQEKSVFMFSSTHIVVIVLFVLCTHLFSKY